MGTAHHQRQQAMLRKTVIDVADNTTCMRGVLDCLIEDIQKWVFCVVCHIVLQLIPTIVIRRALINIFSAKIYIAECKQYGLEHSEKALTFVLH
jgi:hypothetical protein